MATNFSDLIILLSGGINQRRMYFDTHPKVQDLGRNFIDQMHEVITERGETGFFFGILNGKFIRDGRYLTGPSIAGRNLIEFAERLRCGGFLFRQGVNEAEVNAFFRLAADMRDKQNSVQDSIRMFRSEGIHSIEVSPYFREGEQAGEDGVNLPPFDPGVISFDFTEDDEDGGMGNSLAQMADWLLDTRWLDV